MESLILTSSATLTLGPLALPWSLVLLLLAWLAGNYLHDKTAARAGLPPGPHAWALLLTLLGAARLGFVLQFWTEYATAPWSLLNIRDGGWTAGWGLLAGGGYLLVLWLRGNAWRKPLTLGAGLGLLLWSLGQTVLPGAQPPRPQTLPDWQGVALDARTLALPALAGQPLVINLWASWCPPCRREMPVLLQARQAHPELRFLWVNQGEAVDTVLSFATAQRLPQADTLLDGTGQLGRLLGYGSLPTTLFFNAQGQLVAVRSGELSAATLAQHLTLIRP